MSSLIAVETVVSRVSCGMGVLDDNARKKPCCVLYIFGHEQHVQECLVPLSPSVCDNDIDPAASPGYFLGIFSGFRSSIGTWEVMCATFSGYHGVSS